MQRSERREVEVGPGGIDCPCCNDFFYDKKKGKPVFNRYLRRKKKMQLKDIGNGVEN